jgi:hypothetical protein
MLGLQDQWGRLRQFFLSALWCPWGPCALWRPWDLYYPSRQYWSPFLLDL